MKILAVICYNGGCSKESYGYDIWRILQEQFHLYLEDNDIGNVYHHLTDMCEMEFITRLSPNNPEKRCFYSITEKGRLLQPKYQHYLNLLEKAK